MHVDKIGAMQGEKEQIEQCNNDGSSRRVVIRMISRGLNKNGFATFEVLVIMGVTAVFRWFCAFAQYQPGSEPGDCGGWTKF